MCVWMEDQNLELQHDALQRRVRAPRRRAGAQCRPGSIRTNRGAVLARQDDVLLVRKLDRLDPTVRGFTELVEKLQERRDCSSAASRSPSTPPPPRGGSSSTSHRHLRTNGARPDPGAHPRGLRCGAPQGSHGRATAKDVAGPKEVSISVDRERRVAQGRGRRPRCVLGDTVPLGPHCSSPAARTREADAVHARASRAFAASFASSRSRCNT